MRTRSRRSASATGGYRPKYRPRGPRYSGADSEDETLADAIARWKREHASEEEVMSFFRGVGLPIKYACGSNGGEWGGPCPICGGADRFRIWPAGFGRDTTPVTWCRKEDRYRDLLWWRVWGSGRDPELAGTTREYLISTGYVTAPVPEHRAMPGGRGCVIARLDVGRTRDRRVRIRTADDLPPDPLLESEGYEAAERAAILEFDSVPMAHGPQVTA